MRRLVLHQYSSPSDTLALTAAIRDLHRCYPDQFVTDVRTSHPELWEHNPNITPLEDSSTERMDCHQTLVHQSNRAPHHCLQGIVHFLNERLRLEIQLSHFRGDIHLSELEKTWPSPVMESAEYGGRYWLIVAGGNRDCSIKWWDQSRFQRVVDHFKGVIQFVQIGAVGEFHPELEGVIDLRAQTDLRQLIRLVYHADGVVCPNTLAMHLAAAVDTKSTPTANRPCVVIAGGREPPHWKAYPGHQFIHTNGMLPCCTPGGCWRSRTAPLRGRSELNRPERLCVDVAGRLPRCMDMITPEMVIQRIELYREGQRHAEATTARDEQGDDTGSVEVGTPGTKLAFEDAWAAAEAHIKSTPAYPATYEGRGIVICAGGVRYLTGAWVCISMLRRLGCDLPVQVWYRGAEEMDDHLKTVFASLGVECVDALDVAQQNPANLGHGWAVKPYSILHSPFKEVLLLDADNVPIVNPAFLFESDPFKQTGAIFWPDYTRLEPNKSIWKLCGVAYRDEPEFETGQIVVDKSRCWVALQLTMWFNEHWELFYPYTRGDKETFHMAFRRLSRAFSMPVTPIFPLVRTMCQHDFEGRRIFQHRNFAKWTLVGPNQRIAGFEYEKECLDYLEDLRGRWDGTIAPPASANAPAPTQRICVRAPLNAHTGYGQMAGSVISELQKTGCEVIIHSDEIHENYAALPPNIREAVKPEAIQDEWELVMYPPYRPPVDGKRSVFFTTWETNRLPHKAVRNLNRAEHIIVPCRWNAESFRNSGVTRPIRVVPLGVEGEVFYHRPMRMNGPCVFGTAGRMDGGGLRKGLNEIVDLFQQAFPDEEDVRLEVKAFPDCGLARVEDHRIKLIQAYYTDEELAQWYAGLTCFVSLSKGEGWGLMQHQSLAVGRPLIGVRYGGVAEFFDETNGYPVGYTLTKAQGVYEGYGEWAEPDGDQVVEQMRRVYSQRDEAREKGLNGVKAASRFTWDRTARQVVEVLQEAGQIRRPAKHRRPSGAKVITMTLCNRPGYTKAVLEALRNCEGIEEYLILPRIEPGNEEVIELARSIDFAEVKVRVNDHTLGCGLNTFYAWEDGFRHADFIVHIEDDTVPASDCLRYMEHCREEYRHDPEIFSVAAYNREPCDPAKYHDLARRDKYTCWLLGLWVHRWEWARNRWNPDPSRYASHLAAQVREKNLKEIFPLLSRSQNIGAKGGVHVPSETWHRENQVAQLWAGDVALPQGQFREPNRRLVTAVMITGLHADRYPLARLAIECFQNQTYPNKELLIINHGEQSLFCPDPRIRELRVTKGNRETVGDLRNLGLEYGRGDLIINWDDDDWYHPERIEVQVAAQQGDAVVMLQSQIRCNLLTGSAKYDVNPMGMAGTILHPRGVPFRYPSLVRRSDTEFVNQFPTRVVVDNDPLLYIRFFHGKNLWDAEHIMQHLADADVSDRLELSTEHQQQLTSILEKYRSPAEAETQSRGQVSAHTST